MNICTAGVVNVAFAASTNFQANFFACLAKRIEDIANPIFLVREHDRVSGIVRQRGFRTEVVCEYSGTSLLDKLRDASEAQVKIAELLEKYNIKLLLTERWPPAVRAAFGVRVPVVAMFYDEREYAVNRLVFPLARFVTLPTIYRGRRRLLLKNGIIDAKLIWFRGFHAGYIKDIVDDAEPTGDPRVVVRPESPTAEFIVRPRKSRLVEFYRKARKVLPRAVRSLAKRVPPDVRVEVYPRTPQQAQEYADIPGVDIVEEPQPLPPIMGASVVMGGSETALQEAFVLRIPAVSTVYYQESLPTKQLHKFIDRTLDPEKAARLVSKFLTNPIYTEKKLKKGDVFRRQMQNPLDVLERFVRRLNDEQ